MKENHNKDGSLSFMSKSFTAGCMGFFGVLAAIIIITFLLSGACSTTGKTKEKAVNEALKSGSATQTANQSTETPPFKTYKLGESFSCEGDSFSSSDSGKFSWNITNTELQKLDKIVSYKKENIKPENGKFYLFIFEAKNVGKEKQDLYFSVTDDLILITADSVKYSKSEDSTIATTIQDENYGIFQKSYYQEKEVNPGIQAKSYVIFDVPDQNYKLCQKDLDTFCIDVPK
jgi:hypothetical protein